MPTSVSTYYLPDVYRLVLLFAPLQLRSAKGGLRVFEKWWQDLTELGELARKYPHEQYEPLEAIYHLLRALAVTCDDLIEDLTMHCPKHGPVVAALLAALEPRESYLPLLEHLNPRNEHKWLVDSAICRIRRVPSLTHPEQLSLLDSISRALQPLARIPFFLRRNPNEAELQQLEIEREAIRFAYRNFGLEKALDVLKSSPVAISLRWSRFKRW